MSQMVISNIEEEVLAVSLRRQRDHFNEIVDAFERRDISTDEIKESLKNLEERLRGLRKRGPLARS
jgi:hypothetical protein